MKEEIKQLHELENELHNMQEQILKEMISKTSNRSITNFLKDLLKNKYYVPKLNEVLESINELQIHNLYIGSKVSKDFNEYFGYYYTIEYGNENVCKLIFIINNDYIIENILYEIM